MDPMNRPNRSSPCHTFRGPLIGADQRVRYTCRFLVRPSLILRTLDRRAPLTRGPGVVGSVIVSHGRRWLETPGFMQSLRESRSSLRVKWNGHFSTGRTGGCRKSFIWPRGIWTHRRPGDHGSPARQRRDHVRRLRTIRRNSTVWFGDVRESAAVLLTVRSWGRCLLAPGRSPSIRCGSRATYLVDANQCSRPNPLLDRRGVRWRIFQESISST